MTDLECYCQVCGKEYTESLMELICPSCGADTQDWSPVYYECIHGVPYTEADSDCDWTGKDRECTCG
jgi:hypothetical protein